MACEVGSDASRELQSVRILNLSTGGLKFRCGMQVINSILPEDQRTPGQILDVDLDIAFDLPPVDDAPTLPVRARARVIHSERLAQDEFHVGVQFMDLERSLSGAIESYINVLLEQE